MSYFWSKTSYFANSPFRVGWLRMFLKGSASELISYGKMDIMAQLLMENISARHTFSVENTSLPDRRLFG